jgi:SAM-dependent methyltransferase
MDPSLPAAEHFRLADEYRALFQQYTERGVDWTLDPDDKEYNGHFELYQRVGSDALRIVLAALQANLRRPPSAILDFPSGSGRVTRHLRAMFPDARVVACDLYEGHVSFCCDVLGAEGHLSNDDLGTVHFDTEFDLVFCGSLLTHLPEGRFAQALDLIIRSLSPTGIAVITLHGRHTPFVQANKWKYVDDTIWARIGKQLKRGGFGYAPYETQYKRAFHKNSTYGMTVSMPDWVLGHLRDERRIRVLGYVERGWDGHQDVLVLGRPGIDEG